MKKENIIIGSIAVIGLLTLFNTYSIFKKKPSRVIPAANQAIEEDNGFADQGTANFNNMNLNNNAQTQAAQQQQPQQAQQGPPPGTPVTKISFAQTKKNFGKVLSTSTNKHTFVFTNTGTKPLIISNAKGSCGCTVPKWPKEPIAPGATGKIDVEYKPAGQNGPNRKTVTVTANTNPTNTTLEISGDIQPDPNAPKPKPAAAQPQTSIQPQPTVIQP